MDLIEQGKRASLAPRRTSTADFSNATKVESVAREYQVVNRTRCDCGGMFAPQRQSLLAHEDGHYDLIETQCEVCQTPRDFLFDISGWFAKNEV